MSTSKPHIIVPMALLGGVWANHVAVVLGANEISIDFSRLDVTIEPPRTGVLMARIACSGAVAQTLADELEIALQRYAERAIGGDAR